MMLVILVSLQESKQLTQGQSSSLLQCTWQQVHIASLIHTLAAVTHEITHVLVL